MKNKKGFAQIQTLIMTIVVIAIVLAVGLMVLVQFQSAAMVETKTGTVTNESCFLNRTGWTLAESNSETFSKPVIANAWNATDDTLIPPANYSLTNNIAKNATNAEYPEALVSYTYNYYTKSKGYNSTQSIVTALTGIPTWISIIILVAITGTVLAVLLGAFGGRERSG